jgi:RNA polymerase sigma-54 factor
MSLRPDLALRAEQKLALAPRMLQAIEFLQIATAELVARIDAEIQQNETLVGVAGAGGGEAELRAAADRLLGAGERGEGGGAEGDPRRPEVSEPDAFGRSRARGREDAGDLKQALLAQVPSGGDPFEEIRVQLAWRDVPVELADQVMQLVAELDERGLLTASDEELAARIGVEDVGPALEVLQTLEPRGLGARSGVEAMLLQLDDDDPDREDLVRLLTEHLDALARNRIPDVARALGLDPEDVQALLEKAARLDPRPGARFHEREAEVVRPDLDVWLDGRALRVELSDADLPELAIDQHYEELSTAPELDRSTRKYLREKLASARDLIHAIDQRRATILRVGRAVFLRQRAFLEQGPRAIRPLRMAEIAEDVGLHTSTISRAIAGKWVRTPHGVVPLRDFFDGARGAAAQGEGAHGRNAVKARVQEIVEGEDPSAPMSDDEIVRAFADAGLKVARRTVTKYRKELGIPASWHRRKFGSR